MDQYQRLVIIYNDTYLFIRPDASDSPACVGKKLRTYQTCISGTCVGEFYQC